MRGKKAQTPPRRTPERTESVHSQADRNPQLSAVALQQPLSGPAVVQLQRFAGNRAVQRRLAGLIRHTPAAPVAARAPARAIQRFDSDEHLKLGDTPGGPAQEVSLTADYKITYGEMIAMAGDFFESIGQMRQLAAVQGTGEGSRGELEYVRWVEVHGQAGGGPNGVTWDDGAKAAANKRYYDLKGRNASHFPNPSQGDESRDPAGKAISPQYQKERLEWEGLEPKMVEVTGDVNAGAAYRKNHVQALFEAYFAGLEGKPLDFAMATEAFSAHFLTDSFSGGHLRTKRLDINTHWDAKVPMFNYNLKGYVAQKLAKELSGGVVSTDLAYHGIAWKKGSLDTVAELIDTKGFISLGEVVSGAIHDLDSQRGVMTTIDGRDVRLKGDAHMSEDAVDGGLSPTETAAINAVSASANDVTVAWVMGGKKSDPQAVRAALMKDNMFAAERLLPQVKPDTEVGTDDRSVKWDYDDVKQLFGDPKFKEAFAIFAKNKATEFAKVKAGLEDEDQQKALQKALIDPLQSGTDAVNVLNEVVNWTPDTGGGLFGHNQDDNAMDYYTAAKKAGSLGTLTLKQKQDIIQNLLDGATIGDEEDAIMELLKAKPSESRSLIQWFGWGRLHDEIDDGFNNDFEDAFPKAKYSN